MQIKNKTHATPHTQNKVHKKHQPQMIQRLPFSCICYGNLVLHGFLQS